jgi:hypothetical protein
MIHTLWRMYLHYSDTMTSLSAPVCVRQFRVEDVAVMLEKAVKSISTNLIRKNIELILDIPIADFERRNPQAERFIISGDLQVMMHLVLNMLLNALDIAEVGARLVLTCALQAQPSGTELTARCVAHFETHCVLCTACTSTDMLVSLCRPLGHHSRPLPTGSVHSLRFECIAARASPTTSSLASRNLYARMRWIES